jgi:hypothetical protein
MDNLEKRQEILQSLYFMYGFSSASEYITDLPAFTEHQAQLQLQIDDLIKQLNDLPIVDKNHGFQQSQTQCCNTQRHDSLRC